MSIIDICNEALAKNHEMNPIPPTADLTNPSGKNQVIAARFYPGARRAALRLAEWTCILARRNLTRDAWEPNELKSIGERIVAAHAVFECTTPGTSGASEPIWPATGTVADGTITWTRRYDVFANIPTENSTGLAYAYALPLDYILKKDALTPSGQKVHAEIERGILYADAPEVVLVYVPDETDDSLYDPLLREVVVAQVASAFAYPLTGKHDNEVGFAQSAMALAAAATVRTKQERRDGPPASEPWADGLFEERRHP